MIDRVSKKNNKRTAAKDGKQFALVAMPSGVGNAVSQQVTEESLEAFSALSVPEAQKKEPTLGDLDLSFA